MDKQFPQIVYLSKKTGFLGFLIRVFLIFFALAVVFFIAVGIYFLKGHGNLLEFLSINVETVRSENKFLAESIERISSNVNRNSIESVKNDYSKLLYSAGGHNSNDSNSEKQLAVDAFSVSEFLAHSNSTLEYFENMAKNIPASNNIFKNYPLVFPFSEMVKLVITRSFSDKEDLVDPFTGTKRNHYGIDVAAEQGTAVLIPADGEVVSVSDEVYWGKRIRIRHDKKYETVYAHLGTVSVRVGQKLARGTPIGTVGESGWTTHPHLHYEIIINGVNVDPLLYNFNFLYYD